ncbi:hypothetical protein S40288_08721 [Stachybotrys chartarum IBT 40288]|nr:hypothetical protein S40288_08721 [Stachybotrys chartarum IBT 40288]
MPAPASWHTHTVSATCYLLNLACIFLIYLVSELVIWGLSQGLAAANLEYFSSILGMILVFATTSVAYTFCHKTNDIYISWIKDRVDFINSNLGVGFPIPLVALDTNEMVPAVDIARIIGNFGMRSCSVDISKADACIFTGAHCLISFCDSGATAPLPVATPPTSARESVASTSVLERVDDAKEVNSPSPTSRSLCASLQHTDFIRQTSKENNSKVTNMQLSNLDVLKQNLVAPFSFICVLVLGIPIAAGTGDERVLDGCVLWMVWVSAVGLQRSIKAWALLSPYPKLKHILATTMNPVLWTTLAMVAYIRVKGAIHPSANLDTILGSFSAGSPIYALWTAAATGVPIANNPTGWFGAGDAALSLLEVGVMIWGFKLYECRKQVCGVTGLATIFLSVVAAAGNVFLSTLSGRSFGLQTPEALAFAARSTTLALAKPAIEAVGGNTAANAALVVANGILGQLMYPFVLDKIGVERLPDVASKPTPKAQSNRAFPPAHSTEKPPRASSESHWLRAARIGDDSLITLAAGIAIGINGAAMGVAYLYETKSRAAPHAALAMSVFGIMTVVFTTVEPFRSVVLGLANA